MADLNQIENSLRTRAAEQCELCTGKDDLEVHEVPPAGESSAERSILVCSTCQPQLVPGADLDANHWYCLQGSIWSEVAAIQVVSWRMLKRLTGEPWAQELLEQAYLEESAMAWAQEGLAADSDDDDDAVKTFDSNGTLLLEGDTVTLIKDLDVKGTSFVAKRGTTVKNIHLTNNPEHVEGRVNKMSIVLKTCFLKKIS
jgi:protein PhnA